MRLEMKQRIRALDRRVRALASEKICHAMEAEFKRALYERSVVGAIQAVTQHLARHFPGAVAGAGRNELQNHPVVL